MLALFAFLLVILGCGGSLLGPPLVVCVNVSIFTVPVTIRNQTGETVFLEQNTNGIWTRIASISPAKEPVPTTKLQLGSWSIEDSFSFEFESGQASQYTRSEIVAMVKLKCQDFTLHEQGGRPVLEPTTESTSQPVAGAPNPTSRGP